MVFQIASRPSLLYDREYLAIKRHPEQKMSVT